MRGDKEIRIFESTESIRNLRKGDMKLLVISRWDHLYTPVCFKRVKGFGKDYEVVSFSIRRCIGITSACTSKWEEVKELKIKKKNDLLERGYTFSK